MPIKAKACAVCEHISKVLTPSSAKMVGLGGLEPPTSPLSGVRSDQTELQAQDPSRYGQNNECGRLPGTCAFCKEVIQPQVPLGLPCYDFTPVMDHSVASAPLAVRLPASGATHSHGVTGGVYKARERIHRSMLTCDY